MGESKGARFWLSERNSCERVRGHISRGWFLRRADYFQSSRRPFTPSGHWLITSQLDLQSFVEAAV